MKSSEPCPYAIEVLHCKKSTSPTVISLLIKSNLVKGLGNYVRHLKKLPLCVFGGHLVSMYIPTKKRRGILHLLLKNGREIFACL
jgi:hypothetical protein